MDLNLTILTIPVVIVSRDDTVDECEENGHARNEKFGRSLEQNLLGRLFALGDPSLRRLWPNFCALGFDLGRVFVSGSLKFPDGLYDEDDEGDDDASDQPDVDELQIS